MAKLATYGLGGDALKLSKNSLMNRKPKIKVNGSYSTYRDSTVGILQGSVLGPFCLFLC